MARYHGGDGHYADVECAYAELERYLVLSLAWETELITLANFAAGNAVIH